MNLFSTFQNSFQNWVYKHNRIKLNIYKVPTIIIKTTKELQKITTLRKLSYFRQISHFFGSNPKLQLLKQKNG